MRLSDGRVRDVTLGTPIDAIGTGTDNLSVRTGLGVFGIGPTRITFSVGMNVPGDFTLRWPESAGALDGATRVWSRDGRSVYVVADTEDGRVLLRLDDPRPNVSIRPKIVGHLPEGAEVDEVEIAGRWALIQIWGLGSCREGLANLRTGEAYLMGRCVMSEAWLPRP
jgi:hypothetical protein